MKNWWVAAFGILGGLLGAGIILLTVSKPRGEAITLRPPPTPASILIHVAGAVAHPGVYSLPVNSRVQDAVDVAGGLLPEANPEALNLAAFLQDGQQVLIPEIGKSPPAATPTSTVAARPKTITPYPTLAKIDINTATPEELERLPGIGPVLSRRIVAYRNAYGLFKSIDDILKIYGIKSETFELIKDLITVGTP